MSFFENKEKLHYSPLIKEDICFVCSKKIKSDTPIVSYDGHSGKEEGNGRSLVLHIECANAMAQRMIIDSWSNRTKTSENPFKK